MEAYQLAPYFIRSSIAISKRRRSDHPGALVLMSVKFHQPLFMKRSCWLSNIIKKKKKFPPPPAPPPKKNSFQIEIITILHTLSKTEAMIRNYPCDLSPTIYTFESAEPILEKNSCKITANSNWIHRKAFNQNNLFNSTIIRSAEIFSNR